jgi:hypothetical protein
MTAKEAIKVRCLDCFGHRCPDTNCPLFGLMKPKAGIRRLEAIRQYCQWCMNQNPVNQCASPDCSIHKYRAAAKGNLHVNFLPSKVAIEDTDNRLSSENGGIPGANGKGTKIVHSTHFGGNNEQRTT